MATIDSQKQVSALMNKAKITLGLGLSMVIALYTLGGEPLDASEGDMTTQEVEALLIHRMEGLSSQDAHRLATHLVSLCGRYHFTVSSILSVISTESSFNSQAVSGVGAIGLMQLMPETADYLADKLDLSSYHGANDLYNPMVNVTLGVAYLSLLRERFTQSSHYFAAYNLGPSKYTRMVRHSRPRPESVNEYVRKIHNGVYKIRQDAQALVLIAKAS